MKVIQLLKGHHRDIALAEAQTVCGKGKLLGDYLLVDCPFDALQSRLGYAKSVGELGFSLNQAPTLEQVNSLIDGPYRMVFKSIPAELKQSILQLTKQITHPINLTNAATTLLFTYADSSLLCIKNPLSNTNRFDERRMHFNPAPHPSSLHPRLARAFVNLTGISKGELYDPFCGAGGILIEAALCGFIAVGSDIDPIQIKRAQKNLSYHTLTAELCCEDSLCSSKKHDHIATDIAYGLHTQSSDTLIDDFFMHLALILGKRAVVGLPSFYDEKPILKKLSSTLRIVNEFSYYLHKTLSKKIVVLEKI